MGKLESAPDDISLYQTGAVLAFFFFIIELRTYNCDSHGEILMIFLLLKKLKRLELSNKKEGNAREKELIERRISEYNSAMGCILDYLDGKVFNSSDVKVLMLKGAFNWNQNYWMIKRECRRLDDGLPIYAVLVMFFYPMIDRGIKLAKFQHKDLLISIKLVFYVFRVAGSWGIFHSCVRVMLRKNSKAIYVTDHCLLQHYMNDKNFSWASCIIVDEAHERSLSTDLLLALIKDLLHRRSDLSYLIKDAILSALADNVAMYSGNDNLGYEVSLTGMHVQLHHSCSLLTFGERLSWVVFGEIIAMPNQYLVCVTAVDFDYLRTLSPAPFDISQIDRRRLQLKVLTGFGTTLLKRFCGRSNSSLKHLVSTIKDTINDDLVRLEVSVDHNKVNVFATSEHITRVSEIVNSNECLEKCLFPDRHMPPPVALFGSGAEIKHLELEKRCVTVDIYVHGPHDFEEKELLSFLEKHTSGNICAVHKLNSVGQDNEKWGRLTPVDFNGCKLKIAPSRSIFGGDNKFLSFSAVKAKVSKILKLSLPRAAVVENPPIAVLEDALLREIDGKALPGCQPWQKIKCQQQFNSSVSCPASVYAVIKEQLQTLLKSLEHRKGVEFVSNWNENGTYRVKISAKATKIMAESRRPLEQLMNGRTIIDDQLTPPVIQLIFSREGFALQKTIQRETDTFFLFDRQNHSFRVFGPLNKLDVAHNKLVQSLVALHENKQLDVHLRGPTFPPDLMKKGVEKFGPDLHGLKERVETKRRSDNTRDRTDNFRSWSTDHKSNSPVRYLCDVEDGYRLEKCNHEFCRSCLVEQCESAIKNPGNSFPIRCAYEGCGALILLVDLKSLLLTDKFDELFRASLGSFVVSSSGKYRFCPSPDCPSVYQVVGDGRPFACRACSVETCTRCLLEYHPSLSCEMYKELKSDPDLSLKEWMKGKEEVRHCPACTHTIEKIDGCNHIECRCGIHICWVCLESFKSSYECYAHLRSIHVAIV
ncbi:hypothetical protein L1987_04512 [Smallanthus sonchifolius]|uniref:Uncharacterized protein n=1 Tax=Smallanthus sonchifolius TaxID=185202 RepID=A0ACB9JSS4_9ASTR|nr:hypothetical protein L1987_04512 [Smallanthus sonchifolius]